jgi:UPF0755 protein
MKAPSSVLGRIRWLALLALLACSLSLVAWLGWRDYHRFESTPVGVEALVDFRPGMRLKDLADALEGAGARAVPWWQWRLLAERSGLADRLKAGEYRIEPAMTPGDVLAAIAAGRVVQHRVTIVEGMRFSELRVLLAAHPVLVQTLGGLPDTEVLTRIGATESHPEGLFLPDTYFFPRGFSDEDLLKRAYWAQKKVLREAWEARAEDLPLADPYEALILASIIEKETGRAGERPEIAGVFVNRLRQGWRLQTDPTVIYGLGDRFDGNLRRVDLETDTEYNTYTRFGLPPTPIALPGRAAIEAACQPQRTEHMFFVARGDGSHVFSKTLAEHNRAVARYQLGRP